ncbi:hypothetical protein [Streptomyces sp. NPDC046985]|uniref:hypothetical protein n=1 Tax=Streptomyces sp. NPDC046985 TaxID=3155377 RepID=UPI0033E5E2EE
MTTAYTNRTATELPGGATQRAQWDNADRPTQIEATTTAGTLVTYDYSHQLSDGTDTEQIQTRTDPGAGKTMSYTYDSQSRLSYAQENAGSTQSASWLYCHDKAGDLTATSTTASSASSGLTSYTYNAASQITAVSGDTTGWSCDKNGNELSAARPATTSTSSPPSPPAEPTTTTPTPAPTTPTASPPAPPASTRAPKASPPPPTAPPARDSSATPRAHSSA